MGIALVAAGLAGQAADTIVIDTCYARARRHYPLSGQKELLEQSRSYTLANLSRGQVPQLSINGQASYQSDVTALPFSLPTMQMPEPHKDQYKLYAEAVQPITDLLTVKYQRSAVEAVSATESQKLEVELYKLNERVNQLFFGVLLIDAQMQLLDLLDADLQQGLDRTNAAIANGTSLRSNADIVRAEMLRATQRRIELHGSRTAFAGMLALLCGMEIDASAVFEMPEPPAPPTEISRPELRLMDEQKIAAAAQDKLITAKTLPRLSLFAQSGYGRPALNMLSSDFDFYYIGGLRMQWNISSYYTSGRERQLVKISQSMIDAQRHTFELNVGIQHRQQTEDVSKLMLIVDADREIIALRQNIKNSFAAQLENGTATAIDYIIQVHAQDRARLDMLLHQMQLLQVQYATNYLMGQ